jgi:hypothetical protein
MRDHSVRPTGGLPDPAVEAEPIGGLQLYLTHDADLLTSHRE